MLFDNGNGYELLVGSEGGTIFHYQNIDNNLTGQFILTDSVFDDIFEYKRVTMSMFDYNLDGRKDLMLGNGAGGIRGYLGKLNSGVSENQYADLFFEVSPNPLKSESILFVKFKSQLNNAKLELIDVVGNVVLSTTINEQYLQLDLSEVQSGAYLISVNQRGRIFSKKIIKL